MSIQIFLSNVTIFLSRRRHAGINNLNFRVINMFCQPVGSDKKRGGHRCLRFIIHD